MSAAAGAALLVGTLLGLAPAGAVALSQPTLALVRCACDASELVALRQEIASAETLARAQELATPPLRLARQALARARWLAPDAAGLRAKEQQLRAGERAVAAASTPDAVAGAFSLAVAGSPLPEAAFGCAYSTGEIIAIVIGFILGILPGIILLIILC
jgi:hypothetical protein